MDVFILGVNILARYILVMDKNKSVSLQWQIQDLGGGENSG